MTNLADDAVPPEVTAAIAQELSRIQALLLAEYRRPDGDLWAVIDDQQALDDRLDKLVRHLAERLYASPRPLALDRCILFLAVVRMRNEAGCMPVLALRRRPDPGYQALLRSASQAGEVIATLTICSEVQTVTITPTRVAYVDRADARGTVRRWSKGPLRKDGTTTLVEWTEDRPPEAGKDMGKPTEGPTETAN